MRMPWNWAADKVRRWTNRSLFDQVTELAEDINKLRTTAEALVLLVNQKEYEKQTQAATANAIFNSFLLWAGGSVTLDQSLIDAGTELPPCLLMETDGGMEFTICHDQEEPADNA